MRVSDIIIGCFDFVGLLIWGVRAYAETLLLQYVVAKFDRYGDTRAVAQYTAENDSSTTQGRRLKKPLNVRAALAAAGGAQLGSSGSASGADILARHRRPDLEP